MTPWQARLTLLGFLLLAAAIGANLLMFQGDRLASAPGRPKAQRAVDHAAGPRTRPTAPDRADAKPVAARPAATAQPAVNAGSRPDKRRVATEPAKAERGVRPPATTASTR